MHCELCGLQAFSIIPQLFTIIYSLKFGDGDGPNLCRVKKVDVSSTFIENVFFGGGKIEVAVEQAVVTYNRQALKKRVIYIIVFFRTQPYN